MELNCCSQQDIQKDFSMECNTIPKSNLVCIEKQKTFRSFCLQMRYIHKYIMFRIMNNSKTKGIWFTVYLYEFIQSI